MHDGLLELYDFLLATISEWTSANLDVTDYALWGKALKKVNKQGVKSYELLLVNSHVDGYVMNIRCAEYWLANTRHEFSR